MAANASKQQEILDFIKKQTAQQGYPPTVREICAAVNLNSPSTVHGYLTRLTKKGLLEKNNGKTRAIRVKKDIFEEANTEIEKEYLEVPVLGDVAAGVPIFAEENVQRTFPLPMDFARNSDVFMLKIRGESMINAGIFHGDYVIVQKQPVASNGTIVVALIEDSATVKTFYQENGHFRLQPENDFMEPIIVPELTILGKVVGVYRIL